MIHVQRELDEQRAGAVAQAGDFVGPLHVHLGGHLASQCGRHHGEQALVTCGVNLLHLVLEVVAQPRLQVRCDVHVHLCHDSAHA